MKSNDRFLSLLIHLPDTETMPRISKILYGYHFPFPGPKAHHVAIAKMIDAFSERLDTTFLLRRYKKGFTDSIRNYFGLERDLHIRQLFSLDFLPVALDFVYWVSLGMEFDRISKNFSYGEVAVYYRYSGKLSKLMADHACRHETPFFTEIHKGIKSQEEVVHLRQMRGIVVISDELRNHLLDLGVESDKILLAPSGVDTRCYEKGSQNSKEKIRDNLSLPISKNLVVYTGKPYKDRGAEILVESAEFLDDSTLVLIVGALPEDLKRINRTVEEKNLQSKVRIEGHKPSYEIPMYQLAADVLVMPYSENWGLQKWASPVKMFEYMASGNPIVSTDFPNIREVLNGENSVLVPPGDSRALARGIKKCLEDKEFSRSIGMRARTQVSEYSWENRSIRVMDFMNSLL